MAMDYRRPTRRRFRLLGVMICLGALNVAYAHHSFGAFDLEQQRVIRGAVVSFEWINPHVWTRIRPDGDIEDETVYSFEGMSPDYLGRRGWNRQTLQVGDVIEIAYFPLKDGKLGGMFLRTILADGTVKVMVDAD